MTQCIEGSAVCGARSLTQPMEAEGCACVESIPATGTGSARSKGDISSGKGKRKPRCYPSPPPITMTASPSLSAIVTGAPSVVTCVCVVSCSAGDAGPEEEAEGKEGEGTQEVSSCQSVSGVMSCHVVSVMSSDCLTLDEWGDCLRCVPSLRA